MDMNAKEIELQLWRSGLLKTDAKRQVIENVAAGVTHSAHRAFTRHRHLIEQPHNTAYPQALPMPCT
jgi:hypothetical protein